jgi:hypothetical protein
VLQIDAQYLLAEYFMQNEARKQEWKNILLVVGKRPRDSKGKNCYETVAINMQTEKRVTLLIDSLLIDN